VVNFNIVGHNANKYLFFQGLKNLSFIIY